MEEPDPVHGLSMNATLEADLAPALHGGQQYCGYGDSAFAIKPWLSKGFQGAAANVEPGKSFNKAMNSARECVEWGYGKNVALWPVVDFEKQWKIQRQPTGVDFEVYMFWTNCHTCAYGAETANYFGCRPPSLSQYLQIMKVY